MEDTLSVDVLWELAKKDGDEGKMAKELLKLRGILVDKAQVPETIWVTYHPEEGAMVYEEVETAKKDLEIWGRGILAGPFDLRKVSETQLVHRAHTWLNSHSNDDGDMYVTGRLAEKLAEFVQSEVRMAAHPVSALSENMTGEGLSLCIHDNYGMCAKCVEEGRYIYVRARDRHKNCVTSSNATMGKPTCFYLKDGTKISLKRGERMEFAWLEHEKQAVLRPSSADRPLKPHSKTLVKALLIRLIRVQGEGGRAELTGDELARAKQQHLDVRDDGHKISLGIRWDT